MFSGTDAGDQYVTQDGSDAALPRKIRREPKNVSAKAAKELSELRDARNKALSGAVVSYRKGDPKPDLPPGNYDYDTEGDRW